MAKEMSKADKVAVYDALKREKDLLNLYLYDTALKGTKPDAVERWSNGSKVDPVKGKVSLYRATGAAGGYVVITADYGTIGGSASVYYLEDAYQHLFAYFYIQSLRDAIVEIRETRNKMLREAAK